MWLKKIMCFYICDALKIVRLTEGGGRRVFIYRNISQIDFHLGFIRLFCLHCCLDLRLEGGG